MKQINFTPKQTAELNRINSYFLEAAAIIDDTVLRAKVSAKILSRMSCLADRLVKKETVKGKWKIGDVVVDEDGCIGVVCIRYADGDIVSFRTDSAHPNPRIVNESDVTRFAGNKSFQQMVKAALELL